MTPVSGPPLGLYGLPIWLRDCPPETVRAATAACAAHAHDADDLRLLLRLLGILP